MKHLIFYKTNDVFLAEEMLKNEGIAVEVVPTPVQDKAYCGVCVKIRDNFIERSQLVLSNVEYKLID